MERKGPAALLRQLEQRARRRFGQHFLTDPAIADRMVRASRVKEGDRVVEIGPGLGILTDALLRAGVELTAVELDRDLAEHLRATRPGLRLVQADALQVDWAELCPGSGWKVVANLPYNVGTTVLMNLLRCPDTVRVVSVMLQREVVHRLMATPGSRTYGALSVEAQVRGAPVFLFELGPGAFHPRPKVHSAVIRFDLFDAPDTGGVPAAQFDRVVRAAFASRRKTLRNSLGAVYGRDGAGDALERAGIDPRLRAEVLSLDQFRGLAAELCRSH